MRVPDQIKKCVVFIGYQMADLSYRYAGSAFFFGDDTKNPIYAYLITARHVIDEIARRGLLEVWIRLNAKAGDSKWFKNDRSAWIRHPDLDIAMYFGFPSDDADHMILHRHLALTPPIAEKLNIGVGD